MGKTDPEIIAAGTWLLDMMHKAGFSAEEGLTVLQVSVGIGHNAGQQVGKAESTEASLARATKILDQLYANGVLDLKFRHDELGALREVSNAAKGVASHVLHEGKLENHGHREHPGACVECALLNGLVDALLALNKVDGIEE